jgi:hypothetical protein
MREEMIVLSLVPRAVGEQSLREQRLESRRPIQCTFHQRAVGEQRTGGEHGRIVPHLTVGQPFVVRGDQLYARLDDAVAHALTTCARARRAGFQEAHREHELEQPDGLEIGAEERARRPEHVVPIRVGEIPVGVTIEQAPRRIAALRIVEDDAEHRGVQHSLSEPELIPVGPEAVVQLAGLLRAAVRADVPGVDRIEAQVRAVARAAAARAREQRLLARDLDRAGSRRPAASGARDPRAAAERDASAAESRSRLTARSVAPATSRAR